MQIERELEDLKAQIIVLEAKANTGRLDLDRLRRYEPKSQSTYCCPWHWIEFERKQRPEDTGRKFDRLDFRSDDTCTALPPNRRSLAITRCSGLVRDLRRYHDCRSGCLAQADGHCGLRFWAVSLVLAAARSALSCWGPCRRSVSKNQIICSPVFNTSKSMSSLPVALPGLGVTLEFLLPSNAHN